MTPPPNAGSPAQASNLKVALAAAAIAASMVGLTYASVPLYRLFCQVTGFAGTPQRAEKAPAAASDRMMTVRFDANTAPSLPWLFAPEQLEMKVKVGEQNLAFYRAVNRSDRTITGSAVFNVTPDEAGAYFSKIQCFCFSRQTLKPGESADLAVSFFVDPSIEKDRNMRALSTITLSYTFYPADPPEAVSSAQAPAETVN